MPTAVARLVVAAQLVRMEPVEVADLTMEPVAMQFPDKEIVAVTGVTAARAVVVVVPR